METKNVLGLDLGTNSIGWSIIKLPKNYFDYGQHGKIELLGSRILPDSDYKKAFEIGQTKSPKVKTPAANRRIMRGSRRLKHRYKLRRTRLIKVFKALKWIPEDFPEDFKKAKQLNPDFTFHISDFVPIADSTYEEFYRNFGYPNHEIKAIIEEIKYRRIHGKCKNDNIKLLPEDWIVYYLRTKALTQRIEIYELVRIIYMLNQRRGFKSGREDLKDAYSLPYEEFLRRKDNKDYGENGIETKFVTITKIEKIEQITNEPDKNGKFKFRITLEDKRVDPYEIDYKVKQTKGESIEQTNTLLDQLGKEFTFLVTQKIDKKGKFTQNKPQNPEEDDWELCTTALDEKIQIAQFAGKYFFNELVSAYKDKRSFKIRQYPVFRWRYEQELETIWRKQCELNRDLDKLNNDKNVLHRLANILYPTQAKNKLSKLKEFLANDLLYIISKDIIYYQRDLKSQKSFISECRYEKRIGKEKDENGNFIKTGIYGLKCIPKSSPIFQEFRIWQDIHNIRILKREEIVEGKTKLDTDCTLKYINDEVKAALFDLFDLKTTIYEEDILNLIKKYHAEDDIVISKSKDTPNSHRINLFANRESLKGNETKSKYRSIFNKAVFDGEELLNNPENLFKLWHIEYSITNSDEEKSKKGITTALNKLLPDKPNKEKVIELFTKLPPITKDYGSYSALAIKKLLPLMRTGKYWNENTIQSNTLFRIQKLMTGEFTENINYDTREKIQKWEKLNRILKQVEDFQGLPTWLACYVVYGVHSENEIEKCKTAEEFNNKVILKLKNNSLRNPVVEQVVRETLLIVRDLWKELEQKGEKIYEIHIELTRELKNNTEEKLRIADAQKKNFEEKQRTKALLKELLNGTFEQYNINEEIEITGFEVRPNPDNPIDIEKFRIWKSLSKFNDNYWDKKVKDEKIPSKQQVKKYILWLTQNCRSPYTGKIIPLSKLFDSNQYEIEHIIPRAKLKNDSINNLVISELGVNKAKGDQLAANFISSSNGKCKYGNIEYALLTYEAYSQFVKDTFWHNRVKQKNLLATEVPKDFVERQLNDTRYITKKVAELLKPVVEDDTKIIFTGGTITSELKKNWGLIKEWKKLMLPRFKRLEKITGNTYIKQNEHNKNDIDIAVTENENFDIKRIDHRHHALDALIVAATTREHIRYLNSLSAVDTNEELQKVQQSLVKGKIRDFKLPWENFTKEARHKLESTIVSFKINNRIISRPRNLYSTWGKIGDKLIKIIKEQKPNKRWMAIRKSLFKEPLGIIWIKEIKEVKVFDAFKIEIERQSKANDPVVRKITSYIYDKTARQIIKDIISKCNAGINEKNTLLSEIERYLKRSKQGKDTYLLNGIEFEKITIAEFKSYKTKRMSLTKKEYTKNLDLEKMVNDFPYFNIIGKQQFDQLDKEKQKLIYNYNKEVKDEKKKIKISETKKMSALNYLLLTHILEYNNKPTEAFSTEGLDALNKKALKNKDIGKEIKSVTRLDGLVDIEDMFNGGFYETDKGANIYFVMYENERTKKREDFISIPTHKAIEKIVSGKPLVEQRKGYKTIILSPGDLVYVPVDTNKEFDRTTKNNLDPNRIYIVNDFSGKTCYFRPILIASAIIPKEVDLRFDSNKNKLIGSFDTKTANLDGVQIKEVCIKLKVDRLGNIQLS